MYKVIEGSSSISLSGDLDHESVLLARSDIERSISKQGSASFKLDLQGLMTFNSEVLSLCLCLMRYAKSKGVGLEFENPPQRLFDMARVGGIEFIFSR